MNGTIKWLSGLLALQIVLAVALGWSRNPVAAASLETPLLSIDAKQVDHVTIEGPDRARIEIAKVGGAWKLPDDADFPADSGKLTQLLDRLAQLKAQAPVASTQGAQERFKVADSGFERRITLATGGKTVGTLVLGSTASMRQTHVRRGNDTNIYTVDLAAWELPVKSEDWQDKSLLRIARDDIQGIDSGGLIVDRTVQGAIASALQPVTGAAGSNTAAKPDEPAWHAISGLLAGETLKPDSVDKLLGQLSALTVTGVLGSEEKPEYGLAQPAAAFTVVRKSGDTVEYRLGKMADGQAYALKSSLRPEYFKLANYTGQALVDASGHKALVQEATSTSAPATPAKGPDR